MVVGLNTVELKKTIDRTGNALLILFNDYDEYKFVGNVHNLSRNKGKLHFSWQLPHMEHVSPFTKALISSSGTRLLWASEIDPIRLDGGVKRYEIEIEEEA